MKEFLHEGNLSHLRHLQPACGDKWSLLVFNYLRKTLSLQREFLMYLR
jgi:hypothetical protein